MSTPTFTKTVLSKKARRPAIKKQPPLTEVERQALVRGEVIHPAEFRSAESTWRIFRIMSEFVQGYEFLSEVYADITIFGSARIKPENKFYKMATDLTQQLARAGFSIITGGGPGIMEAANKGAFEADGESIGLNIQLPHEQRVNKYVRHSMGFHYFFTRKVMLTSPSQAFIAFPGGFGTLDEVFEVLTLMQTGKINRVPLILMGKTFWTKLKDFMIEEMLRYSTIHPNDLQLFQIVDSTDEAMAIIRKNVTADKKQPDNRRHRA